MKITTSQLRQIIREEIQKIRINEAEVKKIQPMNPSKLNKLFIQMGVKGGAFDKFGANENIKMLNKIPKEIDAAIKNPNAPMARLFQTIELELPEDSDTYYNTFNKLYDLIEDLNGSLYDAEPAQIVNSYNNLQKFVDKV